jgi:hypothetical protein
MQGDVAERRECRRAVLSDVVLDDCEFVGALSLDKLRMGPGCSFRWTGKWWNWPPVTSRRMIKEEDSWREAHRGRVKAGRKIVDFLPAPDIAEIYRGLRKGLEEGKNEPGAADFYYGEMEMRRLAARPPTSGSATRRRKTPSWVERALLSIYWLTSGYGLRAFRSIAAPAVLLITAALVFMSPTFRTVPTPPTQITKVDLTTGAVTNTAARPSTALPFSTTLEFCARESISLLQTRTGTEFTPKGFGTVVDFILRLARPVLLAFTVLALRARIKR